MNSTQKWILFCVFIIAFISISFLTIWGLFFGLPNLKPEYEEKLLFALLLEIVGAVIVLFKTSFMENHGKQIWIDFDEELDPRKYIGRDVVFAHTEISNDMTIFECHDKAIR